MESSNSNLFPLGFSLIRISDSEADHLFIQMNDFIHLKSRADPNFMLFQKYRKLIPQAHMETCILTIPIMENFFDNKYQNVRIIMNMFMNTYLINYNDIFNIIYLFNIIFILFEFI